MFRFGLIGLMTDSDNTRSSAEAWYGEVLFAAPDKRIRCV
jgi:hypothetical protein